MMIKFSWKKLNNKFEWNAYSVLRYLYLKRKIDTKLITGKIPKSIEKEILKPFPEGNCYILNIDAALENATSLNHLYSYLELACKRDLFSYKIRGALHLPLYFVPEYLMGIVETNPMLEVKDENIYFKYEQR